MKLKVYCGSLHLDYNFDFINMLNFLFISLVSASKLTLLVDINDQEGL